MRWTNTDIYTANAGSDDTVLVFIAAEWYNDEHLSKFGPKNGSGRSSAMDHDSL